MRRSLQIREVPGDRPMILACLGAILIGLTVVSAPSRADDRPGRPEAGSPVPRLPRDNLLVYRGPDNAPMPVRDVADWLKRREEILAGMQAVMGRFPGPEKRCPLDVQVVEEVDRGSHVRRLITYASEPGSRVPAYLSIPKAVLQGDGKRARAVLCLHGTDDVVGHGVVVGLGERPNRQYASELADRGYVTLAPNYPLLAKYRPDLAALGWESGTLKAVWDNCRGLDLLESLPFVAPGGFGAIGHSLGGHNSVYTAVFDDRIRAVVSSCGLDSFLDYYGGDEKVWMPEKGWTQTRYMPRLAAYRGRLGDIPFDFHELIAALSPRHVLIVAPLKDSNFRPDSVDRIAAAAGAVYKLQGHPERLRVEHPDCGHDFPGEMREAAYALFDSALPVEKETRWVDARGLEVEGQGWSDTKAPFDRLPAGAEGIVRPPVWDLSRHSAGLCVRFATDATTIRARWTLTSDRLAMPHMAATGVSGLDLYVRAEDGRWRWLGVGQPREAPTNTATLAGGLPGGVRREYALYLPLYNGVKSVEIGVPDGHAVDRPGPRPGADRRPVVFYGTSITQGGCASRPGMVHTAILGRRFDRPVINLGFSGNGKMEPELADLLAQLDPAAYVLDCLPNMTAEEVERRVEPFVRKLRAARPATPIVLAEDRAYSNAPLVPAQARRNSTGRAALKAAHDRLLAAGVEGLHYLPGDPQLGDDAEATVDGSHPTDLGFYRMADAFAAVLTPILRNVPASRQISPRP